MKQNKLLEEIKIILDNSTTGLPIKTTESNPGPYPDILPVILHKLKNKLTPILGYSQIIQMKNSDQNLAEKIDKIERNAVELTELFDNLKDSLIINKTVLSLLNINDLIVEEKKIFTDMKKNGIRFKINLDPNLPLLPVNRRLLSLLLQNVIQNSISAIVSDGTGNGEISISTGFSEKNVFIRIRDNGCGIEPSDLNNIWTPFFSKFHGRGGIGLMIAEKVVSDHKGKFSVESENGEFAEFTFEFPVDLTKSKPGTATGIKAFFIGFSAEETELIENITGNIGQIKTIISGIPIPDKFKLEGDEGLIFCNTEISGSKEYRNQLLKSAEQNPDTEFILFRSGNFQADLTDIIAIDNIRVLSDTTKLLTIINILATAKNKEE